MKKEIMNEVAKVFAVIIGLVIFILLFMSAEVKTYAAETTETTEATQYDNYETVKRGIEQDLLELREDDSVSYISVDMKEYPREKVCIYTVKLTIVDDGDYTLFYYINGETEEVMAVIHNADGEVVDTEIETLEDAAYFYE